MDIKAKHKEIVEEFLDMQDWQERYHYIVDLGKELPELDQSFKVDEYKVSGCVSQVWVRAVFESGKVVYSADSDSLFVKGLVALLLDAYSGFSPKEILSVGSDFIREIGISENLSPNRANGLGSMVKRIEDYAQSFANS